MSRSDATSTTIPCPTPGCGGRLQRDDRGDGLVLRCRRCRTSWPPATWAELAAGSAA